MNNSELTTTGYLHRTIAAATGDQLIHVNLIVQARGQSVP